MKKSLWNEMEKVSKDYEKYSNAELQKLAKTDSNAMYVLAVRYCRNDEKEKGYEWYNKAAEMGNVYAKYVLITGKLLSRNVQNEQNDGLIELEELMNQNYVEAYLDLCSYYCRTPSARLSDEDETAYYHDKMFKVASRGYRIGIKECAYYLAVCYHYGFGTAVDYEKYAELIIFSANNGNSNAMHALMRHYYYGLNYNRASMDINYSRIVIDVDYEKAIFYAKKLLRNRIFKSDAHYILGGCYFYGKGFDLDYKKAIDNYKKCEDENINAKLQLAMCYANGLGVKKDEEKAKSIFADVLQNFKIQDLDREIPEQVNAWRNKAEELGFEDSNKLSMNIYESYDAVHGVK